MASIVTLLSGRLGIATPIIQAGMAAVARPPLVAAVSEAGGLGVIGAAASDPATLRREIAEVRALTSKPFGVDLVFPSAFTDGAERMREQAAAFVANLAPQQRDAVGDVMALLDPGRIEEQVEVCAAEAVPVLVSGLGSPARWMRNLRDAGVTILSLAGSFRSACRLAGDGVDAVIASGSEGGGHTGAVGSLSLWNTCAQRLPVPVVAGGGVVDGRTVAAALVLGCQAVWVGTRFVATREAHAHPRFKERLLELSPDDMVITRAYTGKTLRAARNKWIEKWEGREAELQPFPLQMIVAEGRAGRGLHDGDIDEGAVVAGQGIGVIDDLPSAGDVVRRMTDEAIASLATAPLLCR